MVAKCLHMQAMCHMCHTVYGSTISLCFQEYGVLSDCHSSCSGIGQWGVIYIYPIGDISILQPYVINWKLLQICFIYFYMINPSEKKKQEHLLKLGSKISSKPRENRSSLDVMMLCRGSSLCPRLGKGLGLWSPASLSVAVRDSWVSKTKTRTNFYKTSPALPGRTAFDYCFRSLWSRTNQNWFMYILPCLLYICRQSDLDYMLFTA